MRAVNPFQRSAAAFRDLCPPLGCHALSARLPALAPHLGGGAGQAITIILNLASGDSANHHRKADRVGRTLLPVAAIRYL